MKAAKTKTIYFGTDHAGYRLKEELKRYLEKAGYRTVDLGTHETDPNDDYPDFVLPAAEAVAKSRGRSVAIVLGGSGIGECIAANKVRGVRAALAYDTRTARLCREHNDANVLCLGGRTVTRDARLAKRLVKVWLETPFTGDARHRRRLRKIAAYESRK
ncbi:ribose-5-phosphate isomerase [Patescibacteria group bacterium]